MVALTDSLNETESVIFVTLDRELDTLMLEEYPGIIKGEQHRVEKVDGNKVYILEGLQLNELTDFLEKYKNYEYKMREKLEC